jgi:methylthioribose-1-phosphate isomerase
MHKLEAKNTMMGEFLLNHLASTLPKDRPWRFLTHCNTGELACGVIGTALGVIALANKKNKVARVYVDETRPYLQGQRLTAFELSKANIPYDIVVEGAAAHLMSQSLIDVIVVGADRIVANGDVANKIGTATLACVAHYYKIPFFVLAPLSSFDFSLATGREIPIEYRDAEEILSIQGKLLSPAGASALNPSFDVTPSELITGIVCEKGLCLSPKSPSLKGMFND